MNNFKYYKEWNGDKYLELHDNHTLWKMDFNVDGLLSFEEEEISEYLSDMYRYFLDEAIDQFESRFKNIKVFLLGRSGRHVCVEDTPVNKRRYKYLVNYAEKLEQELVNQVITSVNAEIEDKKNQPILIVAHNQNKHLKELVDIQNIWRDKANAYGDQGSCVLGAGFHFKYKNRVYKMKPISKWQGSISWEFCVPEIKQMLIDIGCQEVYFEYGNMD